MTECPTCGKVFDDKHSMKSHHGAKHGEPVPQNGNFPCPSCHRAFDTKQGLRHHHHTVHGVSLVHEDSVCETCGDEFTYHVERDEGRFCSPDCFHEWRTEYMSGPYSPIANKVEQTCDECGETFLRSVSRAKQNESDYCSRECYHENYTGEDAPRWCGGAEEYYGPTWRPQRRKAIERDDHECQDCGMTRDEHYDECGRDLEVHHTTPIRTFEDMSEANELSNLITVCKGCHMQRESRIET